MKILSRKSKSVYLGLALLAWPLSLPTSAAAAGYADLNASLTDGFVIPGYAELSAKMSALGVTTRRYCRAPDAAKLRVTRQAFEDAMIAWQHVRIVRFGPVMDNARDARIQFWPDKRGTAARQIRRALVAKDSTILDPGGLAGKSVALQSLSAFEYLLSTSPEKPYSCNLMTAIAAFQATIARDVLSEWQKSGGFRDILLSAGPGNPKFDTPAAPAAAFLKSIAVMLEIVIHQKLKEPLGADIEHASPKSAENWRTALSRRNISANLDAIAAIFDAPDGFSAAMSKRKSKALADAISGSLRTASKEIASLPLPLSEAVVDANTRPAVEKIVSNLEDIRILVRESVVNTLGLPIGFNSLDGD